MTTKETTKVIKLKREHNYSEFTPYCLCNNELFLSSSKNPGGYTVIRVMNQDDLEYWRSDAGKRDYLRDLWVMAVQADQTDESFSDWMDEYMSECGDENDEEWYPSKDDHGTDVFDDFNELRETVDDFIKETTGEVVGTWETSGWYSPELDKVQIFFEVTE